MVRGVKPVGDIIIEETNYRAFVIMMADIFMLIASIAVMIFGIAKEKRLCIFVGILATVLFFIGLIAAILKASVKKIFLTITVDGILDSSSKGGYGFIPYKDIEDFEIINYYGTETIAVILKNPEDFIAKLPLSKKMQARRNLSLKLPAVILHTDLVKDMIPQDILTLLTKRLRDYNRLYL